MLTFAPGRFMRFGTPSIRTLTTAFSLTHTFLSFLLGETWQATFMFFRERQEVSAGYLYSSDRLALNPREDWGGHPGM